MSAAADQALRPAPPVERPSPLVHDRQDANIGLPERIEKAVGKPAEILTADVPTNDRCSLGIGQEEVNPLVHGREEGGTQARAFRFIVLDCFEELRPSFGSKGEGPSHESRERASRSTSAPGIAREGSASSC